jgi:hypothetical protein
MFVYRFQERQSARGPWNLDHNSAAKKAFVKGQSAARINHFGYQWPPSRWTSEPGTWLHGCQSQTDFVNWFGYQPIIDACYQYFTLGVWEAKTVRVDERQVLFKKETSELVLTLPLKRMLDSNLDELVRKKLKLAQN